MLLTKSNTGPYLMDIEHLELIDSLKITNPILQDEYARLIIGADSLLPKTFTYVTNKKQLPPSGDKHDYMSLSRYAYPNDSTGAYTETIDGKPNPEIYNYDKPWLVEMASSVYTLALAYYFSGNESYAEKASGLVRNWFLNPDTRMNPNMNFSQIRPGDEKNQGGAQGIIEANHFIHVIDAVSLLYDSPSWTPDYHLELKKWFYTFHDWMVSRYINDAYPTSNVSTWMDVQRAMFMLFTEQENRLNSNFHILPVKDRIRNQIEQSGLQPYETSRSIPQSYVHYNLKAYMFLSLLRKRQYDRVGHDRDWPVLEECLHSGCMHGGLKPALDDIAFSLRTSLKASLFEAQQNFNPCRYLEIFRPAAVAYNHQGYEETAVYLIEQGCRDSQILLVYPPLDPGN